MIVWKIGRKIIRIVLCCVRQFVHSNPHTHMSSSYSLPVGLNLGLVFVRLCLWFNLEYFVPVSFAFVVLGLVSPFPQIDIIGAMVIVWRVREKIIRSVLCNIVRNNCAQCNAHT